MLRDGFIEKSHCPWSSQIIVVLKPDGSLRLCNDLKKLKVISKFDSYPLPLCGLSYRVAWESPVYLHPESDKRLQAVHSHSGSLPKDLGITLGSMALRPPSSA